MSYEKTTWVDGDVITAAKLNKNEKQTELNEPLHVPFTVTAGAGGVTGTTSATFENVIAAIMAGREIIAEATVNDAFVIYAPLSAKQPVTNPTVLVFSVFAKLDAQENSTLYQISFAANGLVDVIVVPIT